MFWANSFSAECARSSSAAASAIASVWLTARLHSQEVLLVILSVLVGDGRRRPVEPRQMHGERLVAGPGLVRQVAERHGLTW